MPPAILAHRVVDLRYTAAGLAMREKSVLPLTVRGTLAFFGLAGVKAASARSASSLASLSSRSLAVLTDLALASETYSAVALLRSAVFFWVSRKREWPFHYVLTGQVEVLLGIQ